MQPRWKQNRSLKKKSEIKILRLVFVVLSLTWGLNLTEFNKFIIRKKDLCNGSAQIRTYTHFRTVGPFFDILINIFYQFILKGLCHEPNFTMIWGLGTYIKSKNINPI